MQTHALSWFLDQLSLTHCLACAKEIATKVAFCGPCVATIERSELSHAPFLYGGAMAHALARLKYEGKREIGPVLGRLLQLGTDALPQVDIVAPVPLHPAKLVQRGYNQCVWLSRALARSTGSAHDAMLLRRIRETSAQAQLGIREREENMRNAFLVRSPGRVRGKAVMVVDDVRTTGSTLGACAMALREAGAVRVETVSLCIAVAASEGAFQSANRRN